MHASACVFLRRESQQFFDYFYRSVLPWQLCGYALKQVNVPNSKHHSCHTVSVRNIYSHTVYLGLIHADRHTANQSHLHHWQMEVNLIDYLAPAQYSAGKPWFLAFIWPLSDINQWPKYHSWISDSSEYSWLPQKIRLRTVSIRSNRSYMEKFSSLNGPNNYLMKSVSWCYFENILLILFWLIRLQLDYTLYQKNTRLC